MYDGGVVNLPSHSETRMKKSGRVQEEFYLKGMLGRYSRLDELGLIEP